jgi:hypothetical protein
MDYLAAAANALAIAATVVTTASAVCAMTKTPDPKTPLGKAYRLIEVLGLVVGRAKDMGVVPASPAADRVGAKIIGAARQAFGRSVILIAFCCGVGLTACGGIPAIEKQTADPKIVGKIKTACLGSGLFKLAGAGLSFAVPAAGLPLSVIDAGVDKVCDDPERFAGDISTAEWIVKNTLTKPAS